ncbi:MAG: CDP-glucose 4,6-dehydratase [Planctomycetota bacterium]|nr:CDP-glucose 4,6-dehydratase [Planctomycetota bacterium]
MFHDLFEGKNVFITGHNGFKGSWLTAWLVALGAKVFGYSLEPQSHEVLFDQLRLASSIKCDGHGDVRDSRSLTQAILSTQPDFVFHLAAQPLVRASYRKPRETFETNVLGTVNLLEALVGYSKPCSVVIVTTDKCYQNKEWLHAYREEDPMGGYDPYSASKGCAELVTAAYRSSFFSGADSSVRVASARAGNVIGGGDWAPERIVPDIVRSVMSGTPVSVRNRLATRPWQHVLEPISGYLWLASQLAQPKNCGYDTELLCSAFNFGPQLESNRSVCQLVESFLNHTGGTWIDASNLSEPHEASRLNLAIDKAYHILGWKPTWTFESCIEKTATWYQAVQAGLDPQAVTQECIERYIQDARTLKQAWTLG